ncbi:hypothetical protein TWF225_005181 [Orbilia oligospora]|nr:hypothetical protein TWF225_005181 [Orbilia oligospora]
MGPTSIGRSCHNFGTLWPRSHLQASKLSFWQHDKLELLRLKCKQEPKYEAGSPPDDAHEARSGHLHRPIQSPLYQRDTLKHHGRHRYCTVQ